MKTILVPTDFSNCSILALEFAATLAAKTKAKLYILNIVSINTFMATDPVISVPTAAVLLDGLYQDLKKESGSQLKNLAKQKFLDKINVTTATVSGTSIHLEIIAYAKKIKAGIIIMDSKGSSGIKGILVGSNAERTVRFANMPVMVINRRVKNPDFKIIVFGTDFSDEAYKIFPIVRGFAKIFKAVIHLVKVNTIDQFRRTMDNREKIQKFIKHFKAN